MDNTDWGNLFAGAFTIGCFALLFYAAWWRRKYRPNFIIDEHGERQRVLRWKRGQPIYTPQTWRQRAHEEVIIGRKRRLTILGSAPFVIGPIWVAYQAVTQQSFWMGAAAYPLLLYGALPFGLLFFVPNVLRELLYQSGYQGMQGAKVSDRPPKPQPGRELVEAQKAHGDAQLASEAEAIALLSSNRT